MADPIVSTLEFASAYSWELGWAVVAIFLGTAVLERVDRRYARVLGVAGWVLFALFWFSLIDFFLFTQKSAIEGVGSIVAVPLSLWIGYNLARGRDSLFVVTRAIAAMAVVYVPFVTIGALRQPLIEIVTDQTAVVINLLGFQPEVVDGLNLEGWGEIGPKTYPYDSTFVWYPADAAPITYTIKIACTGLGSMALIAGLIVAVDASLERKLQAVAIAIPIIWVLNIARNVFIAIVFGEQLMHVFPGVIGTLFSLQDPRMVSFMVADRIIAQSLSVVALLGITWLIVRVVPEVLIVLEDLLFLLTGREYDLQRALGVERSGGA